MFVCDISEQQVFVGLFPRGERHPLLKSAHVLESRRFARGSSPRSHGPLDSLWNGIERRVLAKKGRANESMQAYKKRLNLTAKRLPRSQVKKTLSKMKGNIAARHSTPTGGHD